jgi:hypothetical protein
LQAEVKEEERLSVTEKNMKKVIGIDEYAVDYPYFECPCKKEMLKIVV